MNISATNGLYLPPGMSSPAARSQAGKSVSGRTEIAIQTAASTQVLVRESRVSSKGTGSSMMRADQRRAEEVRGRLADNAAQNPAAHRALSEYLSVGDQERREELRVLGVDVYA